MELQILNKVEYQLTVLKNDKGELFRLDKNGKPYLLVDLDIVSDRISGQVNTIVRTLHSEIHPKFYQKTAAILKNDSNTVKAAGNNFTCDDALGYKLSRNQNPLGAFYDVKLPFKYEFETRDGRKQTSQFIRFFVFDGESPEREYARVTRNLKIIADAPAVDDIDDVERTAETAVNNTAPVVTTF